MSKLLSTTEAAQRLGITRAGLFKQIKEGRIPAERIGRNYAISESDLPDALRTTVSPEGKEGVRRAVDRTVKEYGETLRKLGRE